MTTKARSPALQRGVDSVEVAGAVLRALLQLGGVARVRDLERATGMPAAKVHRYLVSLIRAGLVRRHSGSRYAFGLLAHQIGLQVQYAEDRWSIIADHLAEFVEHIGLTCGLAVWLDQGTTVLRWLHPLGDSELMLKPGLRLKVLRSTTGRVFAAFLPPNEVQAAIEAELRAEGTQVLSSSWQAEMAEIRRRGYDCGQSVRNAGINTVSAPVLDAAGYPVCVITMIGHDTRFPAQVDSAEAHALRDFCRELSQLLAVANVQPALRSAEAKHVSI